MAENLKGSKENALERGEYKVCFEGSGKWHYDGPTEGCFFQKKKRGLKGYRFIVDDRHADTYIETVYATTPPPADAVAAANGYESEFDGTFTPDF